MTERPTTMYVFWSTDGSTIRLWTADRDRAKSFAKEIGQQPSVFHQAFCVDCGDGITAHDPGVCGNCYAMKYEVTQKEAP